MNNVINGLLYGLPVMGIGVCIVFLALVILIVAITVLSAVVRAMTEKKDNKAAAAAPAPAPAPAPVVEESVAEEAPVENDAQLIAVIAAALAAFDGGNKRLVVRKVRRVSGWQEAARSENLYHL